MSNHGLGITRSRVALAAGSQSFAMAARLLPRGCRDDAAVLYAYCRRADDLVDELPATPASPANERATEAAAAVIRLQHELDGIVAGQAQADPALAAFQAVMLRRAIPRGYVDELIRGLAMDARPAPIVYQTWEELLLYCHRVAGTVGLMMCQVMGARDPRAARHAAALGIAMQLTNIARDVAEDWARGRLYIPREALTRDGAALGSEPRPGTTLSPAVARQLSRAVPQLLATAEQFYRWADAGLCALDARSAMAVRAARLIYGAIGTVIAARGHDVTAPRARVSHARKAWLALRAFGFIARARIQAWFFTGTRATAPTRRPQLPPPPGPLPRAFLDLPRGLHDLSGHLS